MRLAGSLTPCSATLQPEKNLKQLTAQKRAGDQQAGDKEIQAAVARMRCVIELSRNVRDRHLKPLKQPLRRIIVSHVDTASLASLARPGWGGWAPLRKVSSALRETVRVPERA